jgi:hypothetical protein
MIQPLRRSHFWTWVALAVLLPALLALGLAARRSTTPVNPALDWKSYR